MYFSADTGSVIRKPSTEPAQTKPLLLLIADAYRAAVFANADMRNATEALESLRPVVLREEDCYRVWDTIDAQIGMADPDGLQPVLVSLRDRYVDHVCSEAVADLREVFELDVENGQREWLRTYAEALSKWRFELCHALIQADFQLAGLGEHVADALPGWTRYLWQEQWSMTYDLFMYLSDQAPITDVQRAKLLVTAAKIQLYYYEKPDQASQLLERAEKLAPDENQVANGWGEYWLQQNNTDKAKERFEHAIQQAPDEADGYANLGNLYSKAEDLASAEDAYQQGMRRDSGNSSGPMWLIRLYGQPQLFPERKDRIPPLIKRTIAVDPRSTYAAYLAVGYDHQQNNQYEQAHQYYDQAIALDPSRVDGYFSKGNAFLEAKNVDYAQAAFQQAIDVAPELLDGYWGMASLFEQRERWQEALHAYQQSLERRPQWAQIRAKIGEMEWKRKLEKHAEVDTEAEAKVFDILRSEPANEGALYVLQSFADDYYKRLGKPEAALKIYQEIRQIKGEDYEANFQNHVGNVHYYNSDYHAAVDAYTRAVALGPRDTVFHGNLGGALRELQEWERAQEEFGKAFELDHDEDTYHRQMGLTFNAVGNAHYSKSEVREAIACFSKAIENLPEAPVLYSNLAGAWENLQVPGEKLAGLEQAIAALRQAIALQPEDEDYAVRLSSLERQQTLVQQYGELILTIPSTTPVAVEIAENLIPALDPDQGGGKFLYEDVPAMRARVERELGVRLTWVRFLDNPALAPDTYRILIDEALEEEGTALFGWHYCPVDPITLERLRIPEEQRIPALDPRTGEPGCWLSEEHWASVAENGLELWTETDFLIHHLEMMMRRHLLVLFGMQEAQNVLDQWAQNVDGRSSPITGWDVDTQLGCARLLRTLLDEQIPITAHDEILEVIAGRQLDGPGVVEAVRDVRLRLKPYLPGNAPEAQRLHLPTQLEAAIGECLQNQDGRVSFGVSRVEMDDFLVEIGGLLPAGKRNVALIVRDPDLRPFVRRLVAYTFPYLMVLSAEELMKDDGHPTPVPPSER